MALCGATGRACVQAALPSPAPRLFFHAAVGRCAPVLGTRSSCAPPSQALPASPAPPPMARTHIRIYNAIGMRAPTRVGQFLGRAVAGSAIGIANSVMPIAVRAARQKNYSTKKNIPPSSGATRHLLPRGEKEEGHEGVAKKERTVPPHPELVEGRGSVAFMVRSSTSSL